MTDDSKALPEFELNGRRWRATRTRHILASSYEQADLDEADLTAVLAAMDPELRANLLCRALHDHGDPFMTMASELVQKAEEELAAERAKVAELQGNATALCEVLGFPVPSSKAPHEWLDQQVRSLKRSVGWETQEHARHHQVEDDLRATLAKVEAERDDASRPRALDDWHEEDGSALWWKFPIVEPPYVGSPLSEDFPEYVTHWTPLPLPKGTKET